MKYNTKYITDRFGISKPTLNSWISKGIISPPSRDWRGWRIWEDSNIEEINVVIREKQEKYSIKGEV